MKPFPQEAKFILTFFVILTAFALFTNFDLDSDSPTKSLRSISSEAVKVNPTLNREPASVTEEGSFVLNKEFLCNSIQKPILDKVSKHMVQINFKMCYTQKSVRNIVLENQSNGFKAQIFKVDKNIFKTDYIQLNDGINKLKLEVVLKDGQKIEESLEILSGS